MWLVLSDRGNPDGDLQLVGWHDEQRAACRQRDSEFAAGANLAVVEWDAEFPEILPRAVDSLGGKA